MIEISNKTVLITGGAQGIGAAVVKECLLRSAKHVSFLDVDTSAGSKLENDFRNNYGINKVKFIECDVTNDDQLFNAYKMVYEENDGIDCVINNAGIAQESTETYKKLIEINYTALVTSTYKGLELMRKDHGGNGGTIINVSSILALYQISPTIFVYSGSKSAVLQFSNCIGMQNHYARTGVRVITICFGCTDTKIFNEIKGFDLYVDQEIEAMKTNFPFQRLIASGKTERPLSAEADLLTPKVLRNFHTLADEEVPNFNTPNTTSLNHVPIDMQKISTC